MLKKISFLLSFISLYHFGLAQTDSSLLALLDDNIVVKEYQQATFKATRVINSQSIENVYKGVLDSRIAHRFGSINGGLYSLFGLDQASMKMNFDYGITKRLAVGVGRSNVEKTYDGFLKLKILRQTKQIRCP